MYSIENMADFNIWLQQEMNKREWSISDLARQAGVSRGSIANILRGDRKAGVEICEAIAYAFKVSPEIIYRRAGLLPPLPNQDESREELVHLYNSMTATNKEDVIDYARMKLQKQDKEKKKDGNKRDRVTGNL